MHTSEDIKYMQRCMQLAQLGSGFVAPNPLVGAVLVHEGKIASEGFHQQYGTPHAEVNCLRNVSDEILQKSTLYVNLEPCAHYGKTPPCADLIVSKKIPKVVVGSIDPNPLVAGQGIAKLRANGVEVITGVCESQCMELNAIFFTFIQKRRPYIVLKFAQSADGFIGRISNSAARLQLSNVYSQRLTHQWRSDIQSILVGTNTVMNDNPQLNARMHSANNPIRIVFDRKLITPTSYHVFDGTQKTIIFNQIKDGIYNENTEFIKLDFESEAFLIDFLSTIYERKISSVLIEGGAITMQYFIAQNLWDEARIFTAPTTINSGVKAPTLPSNALLARKTTINNDILTIYKNKKEL